MSPTARPISVSFAALPSTRRMTSDAAAPMAMRTPNSRTRCWTEYARTPNTPTIARASATAANVPTSTARKRGRDVASAATTSIVRTRVTGRSLSTRATAARTAGSSASAEPLCGLTMRDARVPGVLSDRHVELRDRLRLVRPHLDLPGDADDLSQNRDASGIAIAGTATRKPIGLRPFR